MPWSIRKALRYLGGIVFAGVVWDALRAVLKPVALGAISSYPFFVAAIKRLVPTINWADAAISAMLVTLGIFIPLTLVIVMLRNQMIVMPSAIPIQQPELAWRKTLNDLVGFLVEGNQISDKAPPKGATDGDVKTWIREVDDWITRTRESLERQTTALARTTFMSNVGMGSHTYPSSAQGAFDKMDVLSHRLENLEKIITQPRVYL